MAGEDADEQVLLIWRRPQSTLPSLTALLFISHKYVFF